MFVIDDAAIGLIALIVGSIISAVGAGAAVYSTYDQSRTNAQQNQMAQDQANQDKLDREQTAQVKSEIRKHSAILAKQIAKNQKVASDLITIYQSKGTNLARAYLMQSPFGSNIRSIERKLVNTIREFKAMNDAISKESDELSQKQQKLDRLESGVMGTSQSAQSVQQELNKGQWTVDSHTSNSIMDYLTNNNRPIQPKPTTTEPTQQVQGGLKGNTNVKI